MLGLKKKYDKNKCLAVVTDQETGLLHGAMYYNHPTPSGCERWLLGVTTNPCDTELEAAKLINKAYPDVKPLKLKGLSTESCDILELKLKRGSCIHWMHHRDGNKKPAKGEDPVDPIEIIEVSKPYKETEIDPTIQVTSLQLKRLIATGRVELDSCQPVCSDLYYSYLHYRVKRGGEKPKEVQNVIA